MNQRFTMDRKSFEQFLAAVCLLQQMRNPVQNSNSGKLLIHLLSLQQGIETDSIGLESAMDRVAAIALSIVGASSSAIYFFRKDDQFTCGARAGKSLEEEHIAAEVLAALAGMEEPTSDSSRCRAIVSPIRASHYPGRPNSVIVAPLRLDGRVAGALAAFALDYDAFSRGDQENIFFLAGLVERALLNAVHAGYKQALALEHHAILRMSQQLASFKTMAKAGSRIESVRDVQAPADGQETASMDLDEDYESEQIPTDTFIPGIGVRAALGDVQEFTGEPQPSRIRTAIGVAARQAGNWTVRGRSNLSRTGARCADLTGRSAERVIADFSNFRSSARRLCSEVSRQAFQRISGVRDSLPHQFPKFHAPKYWTVCKEGLASAGMQARENARRVARMLAQSQSGYSGLAQKATVHMPILWRQQVNLARGFGRRAQQAFGRATRDLKGVAGHVKFRVSPSLVFSIEKRALRQSMGAIMVLAVMMLFLVLNTVISTPFRAESASANTGNSPRAAEEDRKVESNSPQPGPLSHLKITDNTTADILHELTRYEIATLRRTAAYADDEAAFQLGMAYETGYYVRQDCKRAAEWVKKAAADGNAAAEYNLGLRYRTGDGVAASPEEAEQWLQRASQQRYAPAMAALRMSPVRKVGQS